jgi:hypothetical protein
MIQQFRELKPINTTDSASSIRKICEMSKDKKGSKPKRLLCVIQNLQTVLTCARYSRK